MVLLELRTRVVVFAPSEVRQLTVTPTEQRPRKVLRRFVLTSQPS